MWTAIEQALRDVQYAVDTAKSEAEDSEAEITSLKAEMEASSGAYEEKIRVLVDESEELRGTIHELELKCGERDKEIDALKEQIASLKAGE